MSARFVPFKFDEYDDHTDNIVGRGETRPKPQRGVTSGM